MRGFFRLALALAGIRVVVRGAEGLDPARPHVYMGNHESFLDPFVVAIALPQFAVGVEHETHFRYPLYGALIRRWGNVPVPLPGTDTPRAIAMIAEAGRRFCHGSSVVIFPEGMIPPEGPLSPFKKGGFHLAVGAGAPIVPFVLRGTRRALPTASWLVQPGVVEVRFLSPVATDAVAPADVPALAETIRARIARHRR